MRNLVPLKKFYDINLKNKLLLIYVSLVFIPILATNILFFHRISNSVQQREMEHINRSLEKSNSEFKRFIEDNVALSHSIYTDTSLYGFVERRYASTEDYYSYFEMYLRNFFKKYILVYNTVQEIKVFSDNYSIPEAASYAQINQEVKDSEWFGQLNNIPNKILIYPYIESDQYGTTRQISLIRKLDYYPNSEFTKLLKMDLNFNVFSQIIVQQKLEGKIFLVDNKGDIIYSTEEEYMDNSDYKFTSFDKVKVGQGELLLQTDLSTITSLSGWKVIGLFEEKKVSEAVRASVVMVILTALTSLTAATISIFLIASSFNFRIKIISRHMEKVRKQEFDLINDKHISKDEIGQLMAEYNNMAQRIKKLIEDKYEADIQKKNLELERKQAELNALQSQIKPHFLFNTLESIRMRSIIKNEFETASIIKYLSRTFRKMLIWGNDLISVKVELESIEDYLKIQKYRFADKFWYDISVPEEALECKIPKMTLQPFIENSLIHGIENKLGNGCVKLKLTMDGNRLDIYIEDDGTGMEEEQLKELLNNLVSNNNTQTNIGVRNVYNRLKLFYGDEFIFDFRSRVDEGTSVYISIPGIQN